jgi:hypothetical protein
VNGFNGVATNDEVNIMKAKQNNGDDRVLSPDAFDINLSKIAGAQLGESLELSDLISQRSEAGANLDQVCELLRMNCVSFGFPDCGHLLSSQNKDIKSRIKSIQAMLTQHKQDLDFR